MGFLGDIGKFLGGAAKVVGGFAVGGPVGAAAAGLSLINRGGGGQQPMIAPTFAPVQGGGYASADSILYNRGIFGNQSLKVYGPQIGAVVGPAGFQQPYGGGGGGGGGVAYRRCRQ